MMLYRVCAMYKINKVIIIEANAHNITQDNYSSSRYSSSLNCGNLVRFVWHGLLA